jgi:hypothetical protein
MDARLLKLAAPVFRASFQCVATRHFRVDRVGSHLYLTKRPALWSKQREGREAIPELQPILPWGELHHNAPQVKDSSNFREELAKGVLETLNEKFVQ